MLADKYPPYGNRNVISLCRVGMPSGRARGYGGAASAPPLPTGLPHPLPDQGCGPGPGAGGGKDFLGRDEDAKWPRRRYRTRLRVRGVSEMGYFCRNDVRGEDPGLRRRCARPRPSGRVGRDVSLLAQPQHCVLQGCACVESLCWKTLSDISAEIMFEAKFRACGGAARVFGPSDR